ncbi:MAG TPA: hypothetical protein VHK69_15795, partial [Chitinophagaceae bacterium]|nr:hypothetical protein [Chitinophagaceae bacterium]
VGVTERLLINGNGLRDTATGIASVTNQGASGDAGNVLVKARQLEILNRGAIVSSTFGHGDAGVVSIRSQYLLITKGISGEDTTGISSNAERGSTGDAGMVVIDSGHIELSDSGEINSNSRGRGDAGTIKIDTATLDIQRQGQIVTSTFGDGQGGEINIKAKRIFVKNGLRNGVLTGITSSAENGSIKHAGIVTINADDIEVSNGGEILAASFPLALGDAGSVVISADKLVVGDRGYIASGTFGAGNAGNVKIIADDLSILGSGIITSTAEKKSQGNAGNVFINANNLSVHDRGQISSAAFGLGNAGGVNISAHVLQVAGGDIRTQGSGSTGGQIRLYADKLIYLLNADTTSSGIQPAPGTSLITLQAPVIGLNNSRVESLTGSGQSLQGSGEARLLGDTTIISADSIVAASSSVETTGLQTNLSSGLQIPTGTFLDADRLLRESCSAQGRTARSTFIRTGGGGLPPSPDRPLSALNMAPPQQAAAAGDEQTMAAAPAGILPCPDQAPKPQS